MNNDLRKAAIDAIDALDAMVSEGWRPDASVLINLRAALAAPLDGPVAEVYDTFGNTQDSTKCSGHVWLAPGYFPPRGTKLYGAPCTGHDPVSTR